MEEEGDEEEEAKEEEEHIAWNARGRTAYCFDQRMGDYLELPSFRVVPLLQHPLIRNRIAASFG